MATNIETFNQQYVASLEKSSLYKNWAEDNPGELSKWIPYRNSIASGKTPSTTPSLATAFGKSLIAAGKLALGGGVAPFPGGPVIS